VEGKIMDAPGAPNPKANLNAKPNLSANRHKCLLTAHFKKIKK
jgi:hypothetical protein